MTGDRRHFRYTFNRSDSTILQTDDMTEFPEKTCSIDRLVTHEKLIAAALAGTKTQQRRAGVYGYPGESFELEGVKFVIEDLRLESLGDMTETEAHREGYPSLEMYQDLILRMHPGMSWDKTHPVWVHEFAEANSLEGIPKPQNTSTERKSASE